MTPRVNRGLLAAALLTAANASASAASYVPFDVPNASATLPVAINGNGVVAGTWEDDTTYDFHGFLRATDGTITTFDPTGSTDTEVHGMSGKGTVVGRYEDSSFGSHGFVRKANGKIVELLKNGIVAANSINDNGDVCGQLADDQSVAHAFLRTADGKVTQIDPPSVVQGEAVGINNSGVIAGWFVASGSNMHHGFLRTPDGTITTFDPPGSQNTDVFGINANGFVVGAYTDANGIPNGYIRDASGNITEFTLTNETGAFAYNFGINDRAAVSGGYYAPVEDTGIAFERKPTGKIIQLKPSGSAGADAPAINNHGVIAGSFDVGGVTHAFLRTP